MTKHPTPEPLPGSGSNRPDEPFPTQAADPGVQPQNQPAFAHVDSFIPVQHHDDSNMPPPDPRDTLRGSKIPVAPEDEPRAAAQARARAGAALEPGDAELLEQEPAAKPVAAAVTPEHAPAMAEAEENEDEYEYDDSDEDESDEPDKPKTKKKKKK